MRQGGPGQSLDLEAGPSADWNVAQSGKAGEAGAEELNLALPFTLHISPGRRKMTGTYEENMAEAGERIFSRLWIVQGRPCHQTDFSGGHEIYGGRLSTEYVGDVAGTGFYLGGFQNIGKSGFQYQVRLIPKPDYSATEKVGEHTARKAGDDWLRLGGTASFDLRLGGESHNPLDLGVSYEGMTDVEGSGGSGDLLQARVTWWLSPNAVLTLEYSKGDTPVADRAVDTLTLGFALKY